MFRGLEALILRDIGEIETGVDALLDWWISGFFDVAGASLDRDPYSTLWTVDA